MTAEEAKGLAGYLFQNLDQEVGTTRRVLAAIPPDQLNFKLGEKGRTAAELMWHIVLAEREFARGIVNLSLDTFQDEGTPPATAAEILAEYDREIPTLIEKLKAMTGEQLATPVNFMNIATLPVVIYIGWLSHHTIHHRGQLSTYVRALNAHVPTIYGGSADEPMGAAAASA
jgi:uncharacterized damage-inducible protein DinB